MVDGDLILSILFFMSFSLKLVKKQVIIEQERKDSQSSFSWAFLWNCSVDGSGSATITSSQSSFSWAFLWNRLLDEEFAMEVVEVRSQSSFSWAFLWNVSSSILVERLKDIKTLNPLFHELFSETQGAPEKRKGGDLDGLSILFFMSFSLKHGWYDAGSENITLYSQSSFSWAFLWNRKITQNQ